MEETKVWSPRPYILLNCHAFIWNIVAAYLVTPEAGGTTGTSLKNDWDHLQKDGFFSWEYEAWVSVSSFQTTGNKEN